MRTITLNRFSYHPVGVLGVLRHPDDSKPFCTIERPWLQNRRFESCIPEGEYIMSWRESPRFGWTYEITGVQDRDYILFHAANFPKDVQGCIGLGEGLMGDRIAVAKSRDAMRRFHSATEEKEWKLNIAFAKHASTPNL
mgnify:CR=1 FL=1|tara:strand:+ start:126 stop:542 length:417 start_codon:yes stop_codon:yes gene_type:complete